MRKNQVSIYVQRFGDQAYGGNFPDEFINVDKYPYFRKEQQEISVYPDSNNIWEALAAANDEVVQIIKETQSIPEGIGRKEHSNDPVFDDISKVAKDIYEEELCERENNGIFRKTGL